MLNVKKLLFGLCFGFLCQYSFAVTGVNPSGVNVNHVGATTIFLTFRDLDANETSAESFWCGAVTTTAVSATNPCVAGTVFGKLPARLNQARNSTAGAFNNLTDIMTIPPSVARRAFIDARRGNNSNFFYVRHFIGGAGGDRYVTVTCRMAGGGARVPLALLDVKMGFLDDKGAKDPVYVTKKGQTPGKVAARVFYNGTGRLKGRWEIKLPGDPEPKEFDLLTEATLPVEKRALQRRYTVLDTFDIFLPPKGKVIIPGPDPSRIPTATEGAYKILLRVEATREKEGNSNTGAGVVSSGGVAGFPMPVLRYYVGSSDQILKHRNAFIAEDLKLILPKQDSIFEGTQPLEFSWSAVKGALLYRLEITDKTNVVAAAVVSAQQHSYMAPPWVSKGKAKKLGWSVTALGKNGEVLANSEIIKINIK